MKKYSFVCIEVPFVRQSELEEVLFLTLPLLLTFDRQMSNNLKSIKCAALYNDSRFFLIISIHKLFKKTSKSDLCNREIPYRIPKGCSCEFLATTYSWLIISFGICTPLCCL